MFKLKKTSQVVLAKALGVDKTLVSKHFSGVKKITIEHLEEYAQQLGVTTKQLLEHTPEWEDIEYQEITMFIPKKEQPYKRSSTHTKYQESKTEFKSEKDMEPSTMDEDFTKNLGYLFAGAAGAAASVLAVNFFSNKLKNKMDKEE